MPRENRKRGKKHKKKVEEAEVQEPDHIFQEDKFEPQAGPSWIVSASNTTAIDQEAPFGYVDAEVKAYFRTVDLQIREWQDERSGAAEDGDVDPNEDRRLFFVAALTEMSGKEKQLATDPDCSTILERMAYSMDDFVRRVFVDRLSGSFEQLAKHRFASHVIQTLLTVASDTISRETRGIFPPPSESPEESDLRTLTQLVLDACEELLPAFSSLLMDPFGSHVFRALLMLLAPDIFGSDHDSSNTMGRPSFAVRSKKSAAYKARQGTMKSVFIEGQASSESKSSAATPPEFGKTALKYVVALRDQLDANEVRALAANKVASPVLQMLLELEAREGMADISDSLMDRVLVGLITLSHDDPSAVPEASDYLSTLLRDPTASHLLETLVHRSPEKVFNMLWVTYFQGKLPKLAAHPVANFVVAKAFERLNAEQLDDACQELEGVSGKIIKSSRTGVLRALVDRAATLQTQMEAVVEVICSGLELSAGEDRSLFVPCALRLKTLPDYKVALSSRDPEVKGKTEDESHKKRRKTDVDEDPLEPKTQGAVLLQSLLRLPAPHSQVVLNSIQSLSVEDLIAMATMSRSSRVLDAILDSPTVPIKAKRNFVLTFMGHFHVLVDDRIGSRVGDRCWAYADPYLKEKVARSLIPHEHTLAGSFYGKFFARNLSLHVLQRDPERWKNMQAAAKSAANVFSAPAQQSQTPSVPATSANAPVPAPDTVEKPSKKKRKTRPEDEIDALFDATVGKKVKKGELGEAAMLTKQATTGKEDIAADKNLKDVLGAIRSAPKDDKGHRKKKRTH
ncbi:Nucleolar protein 9 [Grifola frondosa]|uniref:Nucleolar protein 9 n=1 Tax=Grifola frondosa TaxID=5627 RepID=A0A1C7M511_GRIFR|nr:Nucleolar protein 9 [Grifola frondosa]